ncbi:methylmalonyl-CoA mutase family protein [Aquiflexum sp. LQ15W]|uniref:methylmalonyl-CoA mutase family protein n=1 Tax=Cognataquiflexum nitidum TaxID=2922272 RepID=UPI001F130601|nr:methylmalonyl-CoA mutase family protein [Cognataquiflexum nitidum]MCH6198764.1 methylmalonyl-CoA mutase family protein [Cognataquiflexum nitidum]
MKINLFENFPVHSKEDWINQVILDLKGKDFEKTLTSFTEDGIKINPVYTKEDNDNLEDLFFYRNRVNVEPQIPGLPPRIWANVSSFDGANEILTNQEILDSLLNGADALMLELSGNENFDVLLQGVLPQYVQIFLSPKEDPAKVFKQFIEWISRNHWQKESIKGGILWDGFGSALTNKTQKKTLVETAKTLLQLGDDMEGFKIFCIDAAIYHNSGASPVQELAFGLASWVDLIDAMVGEGFYPFEIIQKSMFKLAVGSDYFLETAKLKAARILMHRLIQLYQVDIPAEDIFLFVETSFWSKTMKDADTNMLRNTTEAMAGILGGANALYVLPHDVVSGNPGSSSKRMARNVSNILKEESYLDKVVDPTAGSYFIESIIYSIFQNVKEAIQQIEEKGGWWTCYDSGFVQNEVKARRNDKMRKVLEKEKTKIGINKYINPKDVFSSVVFVFEEQEWALLPCFESMLVEKFQMTNP